MAKRDESQQEPQEQAAGTGRVYKRNQVHRRRVDSATRQELARRAPADEPAPEPEPRRDVRRTAFVEPAEPAEAVAPAEPVAASVPADPEQEASARRARFAVIGHASGGGPASAAEAEPASASASESAPAPAPRPNSLLGRGDRSPEDAAEPSTREEAVEQKGLRRRPKPALIALAVVVGVVVLCLAAFCVNRWVLHDDAQDIQGSWQIAGSEAVITIDAERMQMNDEVAYSYALDTGAKTLSYTFGQLEGQGRYWISGDRNTLVVVDGAGYTGLGTLVEDMGIGLRNLVHGIMKEDPEYPQGDVAVVLVRKEEAPAAPAAAAPATGDEQPGGDAQGAQGEGTQGEGTQGEGAESEEPQPEGNAADAAGTADAG